MILDEFAKFQRDQNNKLVYEQPAFKLNVDWELFPDQMSQATNLSFHSFDELDLSIESIEGLENMYNGVSLEV